MTKKNTTKKTSLPPLQERAQQYMKEDVELMKKYKITKKVVVFFPQHRKTPFLGRVALKLLLIAKGSVDVHFLNQE